MTNGSIAATRRIFFRYILNNVLLVALPFAVAIVYYGISIRVITDGVDTLTARQLHQSIESVDRLFLELNTMAAQLGNDYDVNFYLGNDGPYSDIEYYNLRRISRKLAPYVFGNQLMNHLVLYMPRSDTLVWENGFGRYESLYGSHLSVQDRSAQEWKSLILHVPATGLFLPSRDVTVGRDQAVGHIHLQNIGYEGSLRGSILVVLDDDGLTGLLAETPRDYGGWVVVEDEGGHLITTTHPDPADRPGTPEEASFPERFEHNGERFRMYRATSALNGWTYTAVLSETQLLSRVESVRNIAVALLLLGLIIGISSSYFIAFRSAKPLRHIVELLIPELGKTEDRASSVYEELEQAIVVMKTRNRRLQDEVGSAERVTRTFFFQNALRGNYRSRDEFHTQKSLFGITFTDIHHYVIICRLSALNALRDDSNFSRLRDSLLSSAKEAVAGSDFVIPVSFDDVAIIRSTPELIPLHEDATGLIDRIRNRLDSPIRGDFAFGVGTLVKDPFLLTISYNQAIAVISPISSGTQDVIGFYDTTPIDISRYFYPLDIEEHLMTAIRSGNGDLVREVLASLHDQNFHRRVLPETEIDHLFIEIKGTAMKMLNALPVHVPENPGFLDEWSAQKPDAMKLENFQSVCEAIIELFDAHKKSHNSSLLRSMQEFVSMHYADPALSLTMIADALRRSENYLSDFYKEQTGEKLSDTILKIRLNRAKEMLVGGFESIDRIARECGYANTGSFRRAFKRVLGISPSEYRLREPILPR